MRSDERGDVSRLFEGLRLIPVTDAAARRAGRYLRQFRRSHPGTDLADYLIAASAEEANATLVTLNLRHFPMIEGLTAPW
jgi:predicted nucleic acid-binding protein